MSIKKKIIFNFSIIIIILLIIIGLSYLYQCSYLLKENLSSSINESLNLVTDNIDYYFHDADSIASSIIVNEDIQGYLNASYQEDMESRIALRNLTRLLSKYVSAKSYILKVYLVNDDGQILDRSLSQKNTTNYTQETTNGHLYLSKLHVADYISGGNKTVSIIKPIYNYTKTHAPIGKIVTDIDYKTISNIMDKVSIPMGGFLYLADSDKNILVNNQRYPINDEQINQCLKVNDFSTTKINNNFFYCISVESSLTGWHILALVPQEKIIEAMLTQFISSIVLIIVGIIVTILVAKHITRYIYIPLDMLTSAMKEIELGSFEHQIKYTNKDEFAAVIHGYNSMIIRVKDLMATVIKKEKMKQDIELYALQAQISPHFLYNSLNSIRYFAKKYNSNEIYDISNGLIQLSKASLSSEAFIKLSQEIELTKQYALIQKIRYGDIFSINYNISENTNDCLIPRFSIQPIVENALFHGIIPCGKGVITIKANIHLEGLTINVTDTGNGIEKNKLVSLQDTLNHATFEFPEEKNIRSLKNIGLENILYRIKSDYHKDTGNIRITSSKNGTSVTIFIPERRTE